MNSTIEEIKRKIDIVDFIGSFITLKKAGRNFKALCPFHQEKTPSFVVSPDRQIWHCFGSCNEGGDIIKFLMKWENITFIEALRELADKAGVKLRKLDFEDKIWDKKERLSQTNNLAAEFFSYLLQKSRFGKKALAYLKQREINPKTIDKFQLGYAPQSWDSLLSYLKKKKFSENEILDAGLVVRGEGGRLYDRFRGRIVFPIKDARGNTIGFSGRSLDETEKAAKYINTPETVLYHKRESLYGIDLAKEAIKKERNALLVEGEFDVLSPYQQGITNLVAIKGSAVTKEQLMLLKRYTKRVTLALDADNSGEDAIKRGIDEAENLDFEIEVVQFDYAKDPDEAVRANAIKFKKIIAKPLPIYDFIIELAQKKYAGNDPFNKKKLGDEVSPYLEKITNPIVRSYYVKKVADLLDVSESSILELIRRLKQRRKQGQFFRAGIKKNGEQDREINIQKYVLSVLLQSQNPAEIAKIVFDIVDAEEFSQDSFVKILKQFKELIVKKQKFSLRSFSFSLKPELQSVFDELYLYASYDIELEQSSLKKLLYEIKKNSLKRKIKMLMSSKDSLNKAEENSLKEMSDELKEVEKKLLSL